MANPEHLKILKQGVEVWNRWRERERYLRPNLTSAVLSGIDLKSANLRHTNLEGAVLKNANLVDADLTGSYLRDAIVSDADLTGANLTRTSLVFARLDKATLKSANLGGSASHGPYVIHDSLEGADLKGVDLRRADLRSANLGGVNLWQAHIEKADFTHSWMVGTLIDGTDLSQARGLEQVRHHGHSTIGFRSLEMTAAGLSSNSSRQAEIETFLKGSGVSENVLELFRCWVAEPIQFYSSFISYSHADKSFAHRLHDQLQASGIRCWLDEHDLKPGDRILDVVNDAIRLHDKILLCCSEASFNSWWVKDEIRKALERERQNGRDIIIPLMVDRYLLDGWEDGMAADLRSRLAADFTGWEHDNARFEEQFERVVRALRTRERRNKHD